MNSSPPEAPGVPRILVVDDNPLNVMLVKTLLAPAGFALEAAGNARQALRAVAEFRPQLMLLDLQLPDQDGLTLARQLRADRANAELRIVLMSAEAAAEFEAPARAAGCDGYLAKPLDYATFLGTVRGYLEAAPAGAGTP